LYPAGSKDVPLGKVLAILVEEEADIAAFKDYKSPELAPAAAPVQAAAPTPAPVAATPSPAAPVSAPAPAAAKPSGSRVFASPLAQNLANSSGVSLAGLQGTGPSGRIIVADVKDALASPAATAVATPVFTSMPSTSFVDIENSNIRKVIADRLTFSKQNIPHYYVTVQVSVDNLMTMRAKLNKVSEVKLSVNDFVIKAASMASIKVPATNSSWHQEFIRQFKNVNMCFAV
jgi:pyruvate dehydrogenase E2 component (dihydrolipoamide acetyltransferase)